ncbi:MAG: hypothetical protein EG828_10010 [Deltaproteobacteria bacterium]|nr:hypothetical protein [Deltaproteobacteria bacterium]
MLKKKIISALAVSILGLAAAGSGEAAFVVGGEHGWQMSFDGMINAFMTYTVNDKDPVGTTSNGSVGIDIGAGNTRQGYRIHTGLVPSILAFNVKSPTINGVDYGARVALMPQINNSATRTGFGPDSPGGPRLDIREVFMTADGSFGQFIVGRALNLYQGRNLLTDMTLNGVGVNGALLGGGTTLGHIGYGYVYTNFGAQFRYTTPDYLGFKWAFSVNDPSRIVSDEGFQATKTNQPRFETELSYATTYPGGRLQAWLSALYQQAQNTSFGHKVASIGGAGGIQAGFGPVEAVLSAYGGKALGSCFLQDFDALDFTGKERTQYGGLVQLLYNLGKVRLGVNYGMNFSDRTDAETARQGGAVIAGDPYYPGVAVLKSQQAVVGGVYYSVNKYLQLVGEYTWARNSWYNGQTQDANTAALGIVFVW